MVDLYIKNEAKRIPEMTDLPEDVKIDNIAPVHYTFNRSIPISGDIDSSPQVVTGVLIPKGVKAKITISTDMLYRGDKVEVRYANEALYTAVNETWSGSQYHDAPVTYDIYNADAPVIGFRSTLRHIESTSGLIYATIEYNYGVNLVGIDNQVPIKAGENLIDPKYIYEHIGIDREADYIGRFTSDVSLAYVPIKAESTVTFNKAVRCVIVDGLFEGAYNHGNVLDDASQITNDAETDKYVLIHAATSAFSNLIATEGQYSADYKAYNPIGGYVEEVPDNSYGTIGRYYPDEVKNLKRMDSTQRANRLRFLHVTDTHQSGNTPLYHTDEFADLSGAKFMTITGDLVNSTIENDFTKTAETINAMTKPCYICMGNHDVWNDTAETQRYTKYFNPIATHNGLAQNVSYYAVDFATEKVKCIWLDQYELSTGTPTNIMSATQINWLFGQLDDAITNNLHVCIFMHTALTSIDKPENLFFDHTPLSSKALGIGWILDVISAFQTGSSVTFEHNGNSYSHTFSGNGIFVSYFCGHTHWDACGWYKDYNQFATVCTRLISWGESYDNVYRGDKLRIACNYVCIDATQRRLSVIRVGQDTTIVGIKREAFSIEY